MITADDLDDAVRAGVLDRERAQALVAHVSARHRDVSGTDEERFRLITGFNDVFVVIACALVLIPSAWFAISAAKGFYAASFALGGLAVSAVAWLLAEVFVRKRRMALPAIALTLAFLGGLNFAVATASALVAAAMAANGATWVAWPSTIAVVIAATLHWRRFHVPITVAAATASVVMAIVAQVALSSFDAKGLSRGSLVTMFVCGLVVFAFAMGWDARDRLRQTYRSDVAFWLHILAAPLIVHPAFSWLSATASTDAGVGRALVVVALYVILALVSLVVDRRALMVSALGYVLIALVTTLRGGVLGTSLAVPMVALIVGSALLLLSAFWGQARSALLPLVPGGVRELLPAARAA
jgi:hypothetical protein